MTLPLQKLTRDYPARAARFQKIFTVTLNRIRLIQQAEKRADFVQALRHGHMKLWGEEMLRLLNVEVSTQGEPVVDRPIMFVGNHISYIDIPLLMAVVPVVYVAKTQLGKWPVIGKACRTARVVMVNRDSKDSRGETARAVSKCILETQQSVALFPSGTTRLDESRPWRWGAFKIAQEYGIPIQPFRLSYTPLRTAAFIDDDGFVPHLWRVLGQEKIVAKLHFHPPVMIEDAEKDCEQWWRWSRGLV
jgi:1-acyl-sn-glycerol-3-phosphate acyltransferase